MKGLAEWDVEVEILGEQVDGWHEADNHELEETQVTNDIEVNQLGNPQYKLSKGNVKYSSERSLGIIEKEMAGMRKGTPNGGGLISFTGAPEENRNMIFVGAWWVYKGVMKGCSYRRSASKWQVCLRI